MRLHRFYVKSIESSDITPGSTFELVDAGLIHQLLKVFRFRLGSEFIVFTEKSFDYKVEIESLKPLVVGVKEVLKKSLELVFDIRLFQAVVKKDNVELVARQATELGVSSIVPVSAERSEKKALNMSRIKKIMIEATEQSNRNVVPELCEISTIEESIYRTKENIKDKVCPFIVFHPEGKPFHEYIRTLDPAHTGTVNIFIGPEGGWSEKEITLLKENGAELMSFGSGILRAETAAVAALAQFIR